jgi:CDK-activating kinase assembly factor MAT1
LLADTIRRRVTSHLGWPTTIILRRGKISVSSSEMRSFIFITQLQEFALNQVVLAVYNLVEGIDVEAMERKIASYQRENKESILINEARKV